MREALIAATGLAPGAWSQDLEVRYQEPQRRYHNLEHLDELGEWFVQVAAGPGWKAPAEVAAALLYHDAVYLPGQPGNEAKSAALAREALAGSGLDLDRVEAHILATAEHTLDPSAAPIDDLALLLDADMAILGSAPARFERYQRDVLWELRHRFPHSVVSWGRRRFLRQLLRRPSIYLTPWFRDRLERRARENVAGALGVGAVLRW